MKLNESWKVGSQYWLPQHLLSRLAGKIAGCQLPWFKNWLIKCFINHFQVDMQQALETDITRYPDFNSFFTRHLKPNARPVAESDNVIICPADGRVSQMGKLAQTELLQAKGISYHLEQLLGGSSEHVDTFKDGHFVTLYLSPRDYHRVHMPVFGTLKEMIYVPGKLFSVNSLMAKHIPNLYTRNERVITLFDTSFGPMAVILVGAMLVGSIHTSWAGQIAPASNNSLHIWHYDKATYSLQKGEEMGHFAFGSTVIMLFPKRPIAWTAILQPDQCVQLGQAIGYF